MRTQVIALLLVALVASANTQSTMGQCLDNAFQLGQSIGEFVNAKKWNDVNAITGIIANVNKVITLCGPLINTLKAEQTNQLGINLNPNCISQMQQAIATIIKIKGSFSGGMNKDAIIAALKSAGISAAKLILACN